MQQQHFCTQYNSKYLRVVEGLRFRCSSPSLSQPRAASQPRVCAFSKQERAFFCYCFLSLPLSPIFLASLGRWLGVLMSVAGVLSSVESPTSNSTVHAASNLCSPLHSSSFEEQQQLHHATYLHKLARRSQLGTAHHRTKTKRRLKVKSSLARPTPF